MTRPQEYFSPNYVDARRRLRAAAVGAGTTLTPYINPNGRGPQGEMLSTDVVRIGPEAAENVIFVTSATHGIEGFCGSGGQVGLLAAGLHRELPATTALVIVHAINPYGFSHERRVTEGGVDLNRNFRDFSEPPPTNAAYAEIRDMLVPADWYGPAHAAADRAIATFIATRGQAVFQDALRAGQWDDPHGVFFGGAEPTWSNRTWRAIIRKHGAGARRIVHLDLHTGLGGYGDCEVIFGFVQPVKDILARARAWYGRVTSPADGDSLSANIQGVMPNALLDEAPEAEITPVLLEFGVKPTVDALDAIRADVWLYRHGQPNSPEGTRIKAEVRSAFYGETDDWKARIFERTVDVYRLTLAGLSRR